MLCDNALLRKAGALSSALGKVKVPSCDRNITSLSTIRALDTLFLAGAQLVQLHTAHTSAKRDI
jgi:hypothetical protein